MKKVAFFVALFLCSSIAWADSEIKIPAPKDQQARYDKVWDAAIDTLFEEGFPIAFMSKTDGYMVTDRQETKTIVSFGGGSVDAVRFRVTMRFVRAGDSINIKILAEKETVFWLSGGMERSPFYFWEIKGPDSLVEKKLMDRISFKLKSVEGTE